MGAKHRVLNSELDVCVRPTIGAATRYSPVHHQEEACTITAMDESLQAQLTRPEGSSSL